MAMDQFLKFTGPDITAEGQDAKHTGDIDVLSWNWGVSQSGTYHVLSGSGSGKCDIQNLSFTKYVDKSSPLLMQKCSDGGHFEKATLVVRKAGETPVEYWIFEMGPCLITSYSTGGSGGEDRLTENVVINFRELKITYTPQAKDGAEEAEVSYTWNVAENTAALDQLKDDYKKM